MSVSPAQNFSKPPPVPEMPTVIFTSGFSSRNSSAAASVSGPTVLDPSIVIVPERLLLRCRCCRRRRRPRTAAERQHDERCGKQQA